MAVSIVEEILKYGNEIPHKVCAADGEGFLTYKQLADKIRGGACRLKELGVKSQDKIGVAAETSIDYIIGYFSVHLAGGIAIPIDQASPAVAVKRILSECSLKMIIGMNAQESSVKCMPFSHICNYEEHEWKEKMPSGNQVSDIFFTSGTTGKGKGVVLTHQSITGGAENIINGSGKNQDDIELITPPLNHAYGFGTVRAMLLAGGTAVLQNGCGSIKQMYSNIHKYHVNSAIMVPAALKMLYKQLGNEITRLLGGLSYIELGSSVLEPEYKKLFMELLPQTMLCINYGSTESSRTVYHNLNKRPDKIDSIGRAVKNVQVQIVDEKGNPVKSSPSNPGRLTFYGSMNMKEYYNAPELSRLVQKDGWFYTNDIAYIDEEGYIFLLGRANDVISIGGEKVSAYEIENALKNMEGIRDCACVMAEDREGILGEAAVVFFVSDKNIEIEDMKAHMKDQLELYKLPKIYKRIEEFPRNSMGKTDKKKLQEIWRTL